MSKEARLELIKKIETGRDSRILCYITGDRRGFETKIAPEVYSLVYEHLSKIGHVDSVDLFLYSTGGLTVTAWGLINLIREFCKKFSVIIPFKAHSCATLIALGADEIIMGKLGQLSPVDPSVTSPYNPAAPGSPQHGSPRLLPVSVGDVIGYLNLAKKEAGLKEDASLSKTVESLANKVHPMALGAVYRAREQIKMLAEKLLRLHMSADQEQEIKRVVDTLTKELGSHDYTISRNEAKNTLRLKVIDVPDDLESDIWKLYKEYEDMLQLRTPYNPETFLGSEKQKKDIFRRAVIESSERTDNFITEKEVRRISVTPPGTAAPMEVFQERIIKEGWVPD